MSLGRGIPQATHSAEKVNVAGSKFPQTVHSVERVNVAGSNDNDLGPWVWGLRSKSGGHFFAAVCRFGAYLGRTGAT